jgi:hypothetical protein
MASPMTNAPMVKIVFPLNSSDWHGMNSERMWAQPLSDRLFVIENSPLYVLGIAFKDVVTATGEPNGQLIFSEVISRGGHSNYQLVLEKGISKQQFELFWRPIEALGCSYESSIDPEDVFAVDVPPEVDVYAVYALLQQGEREGIWEFGEGHCEHGLPKGPSN